jgi:hypothetical protein
MTHHATVALPGNPDMSQYYSLAELIGLGTSGIAGLRGDT